MTSYQAMSRAEAEKILAWAEANIEVAMTEWQKQVFIALMMRPDVPFELLPVVRRG